MERVNLYTGNHLHSIGIQDTVTMIRNGARDAGWDACVSDRLVPGAVNILLENFVEAEQLRYLEVAKTPGTRLIVVCTEVISDGGFNCGLLSGAGHYADARYWRRRFDGFRAAAAVADELWLLSPQQLPAYAAVLPDVPVRVLPHGWVSGMDRVEHRAEADKDIDFFFSGSITPDRERVLTELGRHHAVCFSPQAGPDYLRLDLLARAKVCLSLPLSPQNALPSVSRIHFHLQNRNFVLQQRYQDGCALDPYVLHAPAEDFAEWARASLEVERRREIADAAHERFRAEMPLSRWIGPMLAEPAPRMRPTIVCDVPAAFGAVAA